MLTSSIKCIQYELFAFCLNPDDLQLCQKLFVCAEKAFIFESEFLPTTISFIEFFLIKKALEECKTLCESQTDVINFLEDQIMLSRTIIKEAPTIDRSE